MLIWLLRALARARVVTLQTGGRAKGTRSRHGVAAFALVLVFSIPASVDIERAAATEGQTVELEARRTAKSKTFKNPDGTFTTQLFAAPVHYQGPGGHWREIESVFVPTGTPRYAVRNKANRFTVSLKPTSGSDFMRIGRNGRGYTIGLEGAARKAIAVNGRHASYPEVFPGVTARYDLLRSGVKETLLLANANVPSVYEFTLRGPAGVDVYARKLRDGAWTFSTPQDGLVFLLMPPTLADESRAARRASVDMSVVKKKPGPGFTVRLSVDEAWLKDPQRRFPVALDPTLLVAPPVEEGNWPVCSSPPDWCSGMSSTYHWVGADDLDAWRAVFRFDVSDLPPSAQVSNATLKINYDDTTCIWLEDPDRFCGDRDHPLDVHRMTGAWSLDDVGTSLQFQATAAGSYVLQAGAAPHFMTWDVTTMTQNWVSEAQPNYGLLVKRSTEPIGIGGPEIESGLYGVTETTPRLEVSYTGYAPKLYTPERLRSNGADLSWSRFDEQLGGTFTTYEVHRSHDANFTPSASTLIATIGDIELTTYSDTTAAPGTSFTYRVATNGHWSSGRTVTLPADGFAELDLQPAPDAGGKGTFIESVGCHTNGTQPSLIVGPDGWGLTYRSLLGFDLGAMPARSSVQSATLSLYASDSTWLDGSTTVSVHRLTSSWTEGTIDDTCTGTGATWAESAAGVGWQQPGGDFAAAAVDSKTHAAGEFTGWDDFNVTGAIQTWSNGEAPNHGFLLKATDESANQEERRLFYVSDDNAWEPQQRPRLRVTYQDGSHAEGPEVSIASPGAGATLAGSMTVSAAAADDGRVDKVELLVDGNVAGSDTSAPYEFPWDTTGAANGAHTLAARATDDAGNVTTSANVAVSVDNSAPPSVAITAPAADATVSGLPNVTADASDNDGIDRVEFYFDDIRFATDLTAPYSADWNTLSETQPAYDGPHVLTAKAYSPTGQATTSASVAVTVANTAGTQFDSAFASTEFPQAVTYDPGQAEQDQAGLEVTLTNQSGQTWSAADVVARYRWIGTSESDGSITYVDSADVPLPADVPPNGEAAVTVLAEPPALPAGVSKATYELRVDLQQKSTGKWFAAEGNEPLERPVVVHKKSEIGLGLERYYQYVGAELGGGMQHLVNVASGNSIVRFTPLLSPGRGLSTVVDLTYNALEKRCQCPEGHNWSLAISSLTAFGRPLDVHPNRADEIAGNANRYIDLVDGDGTTHRFTSADGVTWTAPAGVHLYLRKFSDTDATRKWAITRPDRVTFYFDSDGFPTFVQDRNGNALTFEYESVPPGEDPQGPSKRVKRVIDAGGRAYTLAYYSKAEAKKAHVRGKVKSIADHSGATLRFDHYDDGNLLRITQTGGTNADGSFLADRSWVFTYTTPDGSGPAITDANARKDPNPKTAPQSTRIYSVVDPVGAATEPIRETTFAYLGPGSGNDRWKLASLTNRAGEQTTFSYGPSQTTVTAPLTRTTVFTYDEEGKVTQITDPKQQQTLLEWSADRHLTRVTEPGGAYTTYAYNQNGYLTDQRALVDRRGAGEADDLVAHTQLDYQNLPVDANDSANSISQLSKKTDPEGMATPSVPDDFQWQFGYDPSGNLTSVTDPEGFAATYAYNADGTLASSTDANNNPTSFPTYDPNGLPTQIVDAEGAVTKLEYSEDGLLLSIQDARHQSPPPGADPRDYKIAFDYDSFHRLGRQSAPKSTEHFPGTSLIWSSVGYDPNDNVVASRQPSYVPVGPNLTTYAYDAMDRQTLVTGPDTSADPEGERTGLAYDAAGRLSRVTLPKGFATPNADDFVVEYAYDPLDRVVSQSRLDGAGGALRTHFCYDAAGDLRWLTKPKAGLAQAPSDCPGGTPPSHTSRFAYDDAHRLVSETDPLGHARAYAYDLNDRLAELTDEQSSITTRTYNERGDLVTVIEPFNGTRTLTTKLEYDPVGNLTRLITPRAFDAAGGSAPFTDFVTSYSYDKVNRLIKVTLPKTGTETQAYVHRAYDGNGNLTMASLPTDKADPATLSTDEKTTVDYWDPGWPRTINDPANPARRFDYHAEGWQAKRVPLEGDSFLGRFELQWEYYPDGMLKEVHDLVNSETAFSSFAYDANNNLVDANQGRGTVAAGSKPILVEAVYDGFDRPEKVRHRPQDETSWTFTGYEYDPNSNLTVRRDNGTENDAGSELSAPRRHEFAYDEADWLASQVDFGESAGSADDRRIETTFTPTGRQDLRKILKRDGSGQFATTVQRTDWTWFLNGKLESLETTSPAGLLERHTLSYLDNGVYLNGHRVQDVFRLNGPNAACSGVDCTNTYTYDGRDRLTREVSNRGAETKTVDYELDLAGSLIAKTDGTGTTTFDYAGLQLTQMTRPGGVVQKYFYDGDGRLKCVTLGSGTADDCNTPEGGTVSPQVLTDYAYDHLNRIRAAKTYRTNGSVSLLDVETDYTFDPLDRLAKETEERPAGGRTTEFDHLGLSNLVGKETITGSATSDERSHGYDAYGNRIGLTNLDDGQSHTYSYGYDVHGSVSMLVNASGQAQFTYGYSAYGEEDPELTAGDKIDSPGGSNDPLNPYRYTGKRTDTGAHTGQKDGTGASAIDMGARMFGPDVTRFLQADMLFGALSDLDLSSDPLTGNRYALAAGNPISFIEWDGHWFSEDGGGGAASQPNTSGERKVWRGSSTAGPDLATGCSVRSGSLTCGVKDFEQASYGERRRWLTAVEEKYALRGWLNVFHGILRYFSDSPAFDDSAKMRLADAGVLWVLHEGLASATEQRELRPTAPEAARQWKRFFTTVRFTPRSEGTLKRLWGEAEQAGVEYGLGLSRDVSYGSGFEQKLTWRFKVAGDVYRFAVRRGIRDPRQDADFVYGTSIALEVETRATSPPFYGFCPPRLPTWIC